LARYDLHLHSNRSDGRYAPEDVLSRCAAGGLDVVALTDHDLTSGVTHGMHHVGGRDIRVIEGAELSGVHEGREYHLLVYFPGAAPAAFREFCAERARRRADRYDAAVERLGLAGVPNASDEARQGEVALTRQHLAGALVDAGHVRSRRDAFRTLIGDAHGTVDAVDLTFVEAIRFARECGGVTSWAHPPLSAVRACLESFSKAGLQCLEVHRPYARGKDRRKAHAMARKAGMAVTGGSDWHGWHDGEPGLFAVADHELAGFLELLTAA